MGVMKRMARTIGQVSLSALEDEWQRRATAAAIDGARGVVQVGGPILPATPIGRLSDVEWGWIVAAVLFRWIQARAEQATAEQLDTERTLRMTALDPDPWDAGAVAAVLPDLANACEHVEWWKPLADWPRDMVIEFLLIAMPLIRKAMVARDLSERGVTQRSSAAAVARQADAAADGPLMAPDELNDEIII